MLYSRYEDLPEYIRSYIRELVADHASAWVTKPVPALGGRSLLEFFSEESYASRIRYLDNIGTKFGLPCGVENLWLSKCVEGIIGPALEHLRFVLERSEPAQSTWIFSRHDGTQIKLMSGLRIIPGAHHLDCPGGLIVQLISPDHQKRDFQTFVRRNDPEWKPDRYDIVHVGDDPKRVAQAVASDLMKYAPQFMEQIDS